MSNNHNRRNNSPEDFGKLKYKLQFTGEIVVVSGLHIGGSEVDLDIGGLDDEVVKVKVGNENIPYIPGSSLKGKMRSLLARSENSSTVETDSKAIKTLFGSSKDKLRSRLIFRDCYVKEDRYNLETKSENTVRTSNGVAKPRHMERVTKGTLFELDLLMDVYEKDDPEKLKKLLKSAIHLLHYDYIGGSGTRGSGKIKFQNIKYRKVEFKIEEGEIDYNEDFIAFKLDIKGK